jgi:hypothetical protein
MKLQLHLGVFKAPAKVDRHPAPVARHRARFNCKRLRGSERAPPRDAQIKSTGGCKTTQVPACSLVDSW